MQQNQHDERLIYGFDPLCGWCFAFRPSMRAIREAFPELPVALAMGGLVVGERVAPISETREYLVNGLENVWRTAGVAAGEAFYNGLLAEGTYVSNSEPPCRAIHVVEQLAPEQVYDFADALPEAFYVRGLPLDDERVLSTLAESHGLDGGEFVQRWRSDEARRGTQTAFAQARAAGFASYPTLAYQRNGLAQMVARGFLRPEDAVKRVSSLRSAR